MSFSKNIKARLLQSLVKKESSQPIDVSSINKVFILKHDKIGDMVVFTPVLRELKRAYPNVEITVYASKVNKDILKYNPYVDHLYTYENNWLKALPTLIKFRKEKFDIFFEYEAQVLTRAIILTKIIKPKYVISTFKRIGRYGLEPEQLKVYDYYTNKNMHDHQREMLLKTLEFINIKPKSKQYELYISDQEKLKSKQFFTKHQNKIKIGINIEGSGPERQISEEELIEICTKINESFKDVIIIIYQPSFISEKIDHLVKKLSMKNVISSYTLESILDACAFTKGCDIIVTPDTSIVHFASAYDKPLIAIYNINEYNWNLWKPLSKDYQVEFSNNNTTIDGYNLSKLIKHIENYIIMVKDKKDV